MELRITREILSDTTQSGGYYLNPILEFNLPACINTDVFQGLPGEIIVGTAGLNGLENLSLIDATRVICVYRTVEKISVST